MKSWVVTAPGPAGVFDGIGDYASHLAAALDATQSTRLVVMDRDELPPVDEVDGVLHQYSPHFPSAGLDGWLQSLHHRHVPIVVTVHEYWPPSSWSPRRVVLRWQNRRRLVALLRVATAVVVTQDVYARELRAAGVCEGKPIHVIPVGSNTSRVGTSVTRDAGLVIFGQPASFLHQHLAAVAAWMTDGADRPRLTWMGRSLEELERAWRDVAPGGRDAVTLVGGADEATVSGLLTRATLGLAPYANGASGRRSTLAALLQHGVPTVATTGIATDPWLTRSRSVLTVSDGDPRAFVGAVESLLGNTNARDRLSRDAERLFLTHLTWPRLADQYRVAIGDASTANRDRDAR